MNKVYEVEVIRMIREAKQEDLLEVLNLYLYLHEENVPEQSEHLSVIWNQIITDKNHLQDDAAYRFKRTKDIGFL